MSTFLALPEMTRKSCPVCGGAIQTFGLTRAGVLIWKCTAFPGRRHYELWRFSIVPAVRSLYDRECLFMQGGVKLAGSASSEHQL